MATAYAAAGASSMAQAVLVPRLSTTSLSSLRPALPYLPPRSALSATSASASFKLLRSSASNRFALFQIKASSSEETSGSTEGEVFSDLKEKWDALENKSIVVLYGGGAIVAVLFSSIIVGSIDRVPLLPKIMELVGLGYTGWFVYRYLLFKSSRKELAAEIEGLKKKIAGSE